MRYVKVVGTGASRWTLIQGAFFLQGNAYSGTFESGLNGTFAPQALSEGAVYSLPISGTNAGAMSALLYDPSRSGWGYANSQRVPAGVLKDGLTYLWDLTWGILWKPLPWVSPELPPNLTLPAGEPFTIPLTLREWAGNSGQLKLLLGGATLWEGEIAAWQTLSLNISDTMPFDNMALNLEAQALEPVQGRWYWVGGVRRDILAGFPRLTLRVSDFPETVAAGKDYSVSVAVVNEGFKGVGRLLLGSTVLGEQKFESSEGITHGFSGTMPYDDVLLGFAVQSVGRNKALVETGYASVPVKAGFPDLKITDLSYQPSYMPGEMVEVIIKGLNAGYVGDVQLVISDLARQEQLNSGMRELAAGEETQLTYRAEMPPVESWSLLSRPQWVGRNKAATEGAPSLIGIVARNTMFEYTEYENQQIRFVGGESTNRIMGVIAADQLSFSPKFQDLTAPEIPGLPLAAAFSLDLEPGDHEAITFTNQRYFRMESEQEIAIVKNGKLVARKSSSSESGTLPAFALDRVAVLATAFTRRAASVE